MTLTTSAVSAGALPMDKSELESPKELQSPERHQTPVQKIIQKQSEHGPAGKRSTHALRAKKCNGPKHLSAQLICLSCSLDCVKSLCICEMLVGPFVSAKAHHSREVLQHLCPSWGNGREASLSLCVGSREQGGEGKSPLAKYLEFNFPFFTTSPFPFIIIIIIQFLWILFIYLFLVSLGLLPCYFFFKVKETMCQILNEGDSVWSHWMRFCWLKISVYPKCRLPSLLH